MLARPLLAAIVGLVLWTMPSAALAQGPGRGNPFHPGGPLAPWTGKTPFSSPRSRLVSPASTPAPSAAPASSWSKPAAPEPSSTTSSASSPRSVYVPGLGSTVGPPSGALGYQPSYNQSYGSDSFNSPPPQFDSASKKKAASASDDRTYVSLIANPVLLPWGRMAGRIEIAPLSAHALFFEFAKWDLPISYEAVGQTASIRLPIYEYGFGYHLYPQGRGASGFYVGPRFIYAHGEVDQAVGSATAWGADLGYQFIIANHLVLNLGLGVVHLTATANAKPGYVDQIAQAVSEEGASFAGSVKLGGTLDRWLPLPTLGLGVAF